YHATPQRYRCPDLSESDFTIGLQAHRGYLAESSSSSYRLVVHLLLLPTPPPGDAVAFSYRPESVCLKRTCTSLTSRALRRTAQAFTPGLGKRINSLSPIYGAFAPFRNEA